MIRVANDTDGSGKPAPELVATFPIWNYVFIQVQGGGTVRIAADADTLRNLGPAASLQGVQIAAASLPGGLLQIWWKGPLWVIGNGLSTLYELTALPSTIGDMPR